MMQYHDRYGVEHERVVLLSALGHIEVMLQNGAVEEIKLK
jgi:hypothetical protein